MVFRSKQLLLPKHDGSGYNELMESGAEPVHGIRSQIAVTDYKGDCKVDEATKKFHTPDRLVITIAGDLKKK